MKSRGVASILPHVVLVPTVIVIIVPFLLMLSTAFKGMKDIMTFDFRWIPPRPTLQSFVDVIRIAPWLRYYVNTVAITGGIFAVQLITISLAAYAFARLRFKLRDFLFVLFLLQLMIPAQSIAVPNYMTISRLKLLDTRLAVQIVYFASAFGTFLMRQAFRTIPLSLEEAARLEGMSPLGMIFRILIPLTKPSLIAFGLVSVSHHWNEFFWPILVTDTARSRPLTVGLAMGTQSMESSPEWGLTAAATLIVVFPLLILFIVFQRQFIESFISSGIKA